MLKLFFKNHNFLRLFLAQLISQFGDRIHQFALVGLVAQRAFGSATLMAKLMAFTILPVFLVQPFAGVFVDRWDRRTTLFVCDLSRAAIVFLIPFVFINWDSMIPIYIIVFLVFCFSRFYIPAKMSIIPDIVEEDSLLLANSLVSTTGMIAAVLGFAIGAFIEYWGARLGFIIDACTFLVSGLIIFSMSMPKQLKMDKGKIKEMGKEIIGPIRRSVWGEMKEGFQYLFKHKEIRFIMGIMFVLLAGVGAIYIPIIVFIQQVFNSMTRHISAPAVALGAGLFLGVVLYGKFGKKLVWYKTIFASLCLGGLMLTIFAFGVFYTANIWVTVVLAFLLGVVIGPIFIEANTVTHIVSDENMRGKVFSALEIIIHLAFLITMFLSSWLSDLIGPYWILIGVGVIFIGVGMVGFLRQNQLRDFS